MSILSEMMSSVNRLNIAEKIRRSRFSYLISAELSFNYGNILSSNSFLANS